MDLIDNGDLTIENITFKIQMIKALIKQLKQEREDDFTNKKERNVITKERLRIQIRLNNYYNKYDLWKITRDDHLIKLSCAVPVASALREKPAP